MDVFSNQKDRDPFGVIFLVDIDIEFTIQDHRNRRQIHIIDTQFIHKVQVGVKLNYDGFFFVRQVDDSSGSHSSKDDARVASAKTESVFQNRFMDEIAGTFSDTTELDLRIRFMIDGR